MNRYVFLYAAMGLLITGLYSQPLVRPLGTYLGYWGLMGLYWVLISLIGAHFHWRWNHPASDGRGRFLLKYALAVLSADLLFRLTRTVLQDGWLGWGLGGFAGALALGRLFGLVFRDAPDTWAAALRLGLWGGAGMLLAWTLAEGPIWLKLPIPHGVHEYGLRPLAAIGAGALLGRGIGRLYESRS